MMRDKIREEREGASIDKDKLIKVPKNKAKALKKLLFQLDLWKKIGQTEKMKTVIEQIEALQRVYPEAKAYAVYVPMIRTLQKIREHTWAQKLLGEMSKEDREKWAKGGTGPRDMFHGEVHKGGRQARCFW